MNLCPHCYFPLTASKGPSKPNATPGVVSVIVGCTHCEAILRVEITTLREPNAEILKKRINLPKKAVKLDE